jgi:hypothetical protein
VRAWPLLAAAVIAGIAIALSPWPSHGDETTLPHVQTYTTMTPSPSPHPGLKITTASGTAPKTTCSKITLSSSDIPNGTLVEVRSLLQVGHKYPSMIMIGGYLQAGTATISRPHGTNLDGKMHHMPTDHFGSFTVTEANRSKWFDSDGNLTIRQIGYAASTAAQSGWVMKVEYVQLEVKVTRPLTSG